MCPQPPASESEMGRDFLLKLLGPGLGKAGLDQVARAVGHLPSSCPNQGVVARILQDSNKVLSRPPGRPWSLHSSDLPEEEGLPSRASPLPISASTLGFSCPGISELCSNLFLAALRSLFCFLVSIRTGLHVR